MSEPRKAKFLPDGRIVTWHLFYATQEGAFALIEYEGGKVESVHAEWIEFIKE